MQNVTGNPDGKILVLESSTWGANNIKIQNLQHVFLLLRFLLLR
jgi:hypothetical protein